MKIYSFKRLQILPITMGQSWDFFSSPKNLSQITPEKMGFHMQYRSGSERMYAGQIIRYKIKVLPGIAVDWVTEITHVKEPNYFVDEQRFGPYALWHHQHSFREVANGVEMMDEVNYAIPYGPIGRLANHLFVERQVSAIFDYRSKALSEFFSANKEHIQEKY